MEYPHCRGRNEEPPTFKQRVREILDMTEKVFDSAFSQENSFLPALQMKYRKLEGRIKNILVTTQNRVINVLLAPNLNKEDGNWNEISQFVKYFEDIGSHNLLSELELQTLMLNVEVLIQCLVEGSYLDFSEWQIVEAIKLSNVIAHFLSNIYEIFPNDLNQMPKSYQSYKALVYHPMIMYVRDLLRNVLQEHENGASYQGNEVYKSVKKTNSILWLLKHALAVRYLKIKGCNSAADLKLYLESDGTVAMQISIEKTTIRFRPHSKISTEMYLFFSWVEEYLKKTQKGCTTAHTCAETME